MTLSRAMASFVRVASISDYTATTLLPHLPETVRELFTYGVGYIGDGFLRTVDPATVARAVVAAAAPIHSSHSFPILTTAFADVVTEWRSRLYLINSRVGRYVGLGRAHRLGQVIAELSDPESRDFLLGQAPWAEAVNLFGVPTPRECFAFVPPLAVLPRGPSDLTGVVRMDLAEHLEFLAAFHGPAQGRW